MTPPDTGPETWLQPVIHPVYARLVCAELRRRAFTQAQIVAGTRLDWETLHADNRFLSFEQFRRFVVHAMTLSECPWLGIEVGCQAQLSLHGALGQAVAASGSVAQAMALAARFMPLRQRMVGIRLEPGNGELFVTAEEYLMAPEVRECLLCYLTANLLRLLESVTGLAIHADITIEWPFPEPPWAHEYQRLAARNSFGHERLRGRLSSDVLQRGSLAADADALRVAERECERQLKMQLAGGTLAQRVQQRLATCRGNYPALDEIAAEEHVSARTLIRHLHDEGTTYQQLLDSVREELACWLLLQTPLSVEAIAERLGYDDTSNFSRTFRRWLGVTPREFRAARAR